MVGKRFRKKELIKKLANNPVINCSFHLFPVLLQHDNYQDKRGWKTLPSYEYGSVQEFHDNEKVRE